MKPTVKYLINGKYHHATVRDVGDIEKLKTKIKTDLVSAINELVTEGTGSGPGIGAEVEEKLAEIDKTLNELKAQVDGGLNETQIKDLESILGGALDINYEKISKEIDERANQTKLEIKEDTDRINQEVSGVKTQLDSTEKKLEETKTDLSKVELNVKEVNVKYDEVTGELEKTVKSTDFDLLESKVTQNERVLTETAEEVKSTIKRDEWDVAQEKVTALENTITETAEGLSRTVSKEQMREEINAIDTHNPNLLYTTLDWSGWFDIKGNGAKILNETYQHCNVLELGGYANKGLLFEDFIHGETYTVSIWARQENIVDGTLKFVMVKTGYPDIEVEMTQANGDKYVQGEMRRFMGTFVAPSHPVALHFNSNEIVPAVSKLLLAGSKIELGLNATGYTVHVKDSYKSIEKLSTKVDQTADGLRINTNQLKATDLKVTKTENEIVILSDKQIQTMKKVEEVGDIATESKNVSERTAEEMKNKISKTDATEIINGLDVESRNLQPNGNFFDDFDKWTQSSEWSIKEKVGKKFAWITRTGIAKELDLALFGQYTGVKEGSKITFGLDMFVENLSQYDTRKPIRIELYDIKNQRVDFKDFTLEELGVNIKEGLNERIKGSYDVFRKDVDKVRLRFALQKNGTFGVTDVSLRTGAISDYSWGPAPEDNAKVTAKLETSISQKAGAVEVTAVKKDIEKITKDVTETSAQWKLEADKISQEVEKVNKEGISNSAAIGVMSDQIQVKVNKDGVIGSINATAEKAVISFSKIEMNGKVTFNHLDKESQGKINDATTQANIASNQIDSWKRPGTTLIDGGNIYADSLNVKSLSAIAGNLGNITAGSLKGKELAINLNDGWIEAKSSYLDHKGTPWDGSVSISKGRVHASSSNLVESVNSSISSSGLSVTGLFKSNPNGDFGITGVSSYTYNEMTIRTRLGQNIARVASETSADGSRYGVIELSDNTAVSPDNYDVRISGQKEIINLEANNVIFGKVGASQSVLVRNQWKAHSSAKNMYVVVAKGGVLKITETEYNGASAPIEASKFFATGNIFYGGNNTQLLSENGYLLLRSTRSNIYLQAETTVNCTKPSAPGTPIDIFAKNFKPGSMAEYKTNIEVFNKSGLKIVDNTDIYEYNFKTDAQDGISKKSIGIVIGEGYRTPSEITDEKSVDLYGMTTVAWKAIQELSEKVKRLENILRKEEQNEK